MKTLRIYPTSVNPAFIAEAVDALKQGKIIIYPTDTYYALGCNALNNQAIERLCRLKNIDTRHETLSVVCSDISQASEYARIDNVAFSVMRRNTPGAFTFLLPASPRLPKVFKGRKIVGVRIPDNPIARALADELGNPLLSSSITTGCEADALEVAPETVALEYEKNDAVTLMIDGGEGGCHGSTVVDLSESADPVIVRQGDAVLNL